MNNPLHAAFYADQAQQLTVRVVENVLTAQDTYRLRFEAPQIAQQILPGQFLMVRLSHCDDPLIGRPLALYDTVVSASETPQAIDVVYVVKGKFTNRLAGLGAGDQIDIWGPLGNGFDPPSAAELVMVAGGIGHTPFVALAQQFLGTRRYGFLDRHDAPTRRRVTLCYGARTAAMLSGLDDFEKAGVHVRVATDDGTAGYHGLVTDLMIDQLNQSDNDLQIVCCGPEPMMEAVCQIATDRDLSCQVSLETPMACGIGICFTCVARVRDESGNWDYKRTCVDGPVFDASEIVW